MSTMVCGPSPRGFHLYHEVGGRGANGPSSRQRVGGRGQGEANSTAGDSSVQLRPVFKTGIGELEDVRVLAPFRIARFASFAMLLCRDLRGPIDRTIDRIHGWVGRLPPKPDEQVLIFTVFEVE